MTSVRSVAKVAASTLALCSISFSLMAQSPAAAAPPPRGRMAMPGMAGLAGLPAQLNQPIAGKPFTATATVSYGQGQSSTVQMARDAGGRTYLRATLPARAGASGANAAGESAAGVNKSGEPGPVEVTIIADPVAHKQYTIFPAAKNIEVRPLRPPRAAGSMGSGMMGRGMMGMGRGTTTTLGTQNIAGQQAQGLKTEMNVPARGNRPAMSMTREVWRSATLGVVLKAEMSGPGNRQMSFAVQTLKTGAPQAALFQLPAGYTLQAAPERGLLGRRGSRSGFRPTPPRG